MASDTPVGAKKVNLLIVTYNLDVGGVEEIILTYTKLLDKATYHITVSCFIPGAVSAEIAAIPGVRVIHVSTKSRLKRFLRIWKIAREERIDIVHNNACWYGLVVGVLVGTKRVETVHNMYHWFTRRDQIFYGLYCLLAQKIIADSQAVKTFTLSFFPFMNPNKFIVIHYGIEYTQFLSPGQSSELRQQLHIAENDVVIGFVGRLTVQKGVEYLLNAAQSLSATFSTLRFVIVGDGELRPQLEALAQHMALSNVLFTGFQRDVTRYLQLFDIFVLPSLWEGLPVSVLEAMAGAKPVVATRVSGTPEAVEDQVTGFLVEPKDVEQLHDRLATLIENPELRTRMGQAGRNRVIEYFSAHGMVSKTEDVYRALLHHP